MTAQKIDTIKVQRITEEEVAQFPTNNVGENKLGIRDWLQLLSQFVTVGGDFAN